MPLGVYGYPIQWRLERQGRMPGKCYNVLLLLIHYCDKRSHFWECVIRIFFWGDGDFHTFLFLLFLIFNDSNAAKTAAMKIIGNVGSNDFTGAAPVNKEETSNSAV